MKKYTLEEIRAKFPDYIKLLKRMEFKRYEDGGDYVYMGVEGKRPFGNSNIHHDIAEILGWELPNDDLSYEQHGQLNECKKYLDRLPDFLNFLINQL
jgi:hypothetical protein